MKSKRRTTLRHLSRVEVVQLLLSLFGRVGLSGPERVWACGNIVDEPSPDACASDPPAREGVGKLRAIRFFAATGKIGISDAIRPFDPIYAEPMADVLFRVPQVLD